MKVTIRKANTGDLNRLAEFQQGLALETENVTLEKSVLLAGLQAVLDDPSKGIYHVAEADGEVVGCFFITYEWSEWKNGNVWWLQSVYVKMSHRGRGVFKTMYQYITERINADPQILGLRLYVDKRNVAAQKVYAQLSMNGEHYTVFEKMKR